MERIEEIREAVACALERVGLSNPGFVQEVRAGRRDDGPFMMGALAWEERLNSAPAE